MSLSSRRTAFSLPTILLKEKDAWFGKHLQYGGEGEGPRALEIQGRVLLHLHKSTNKRSSILWIGTTGLPGFLRVVV